MILPLKGVSTAKLHKQRRAAQHSPNQKKLLKKLPHTFPHAPREGVSHPTCNAGGGEPPPPHEARGKTPQKNQIKKYTKSTKNDHFNKPTRDPPHVQCKVRCNVFHSSFFELQPFQPKSSGRKFVACYGPLAPCHSSPAKKPKSESLLPCCCTAHFVSFRPCMAPAKATN